MDSAERQLRRATSGPGRLAPAAAPLTALVAACAVVAACAGTSSPWPAAALPVLLVAVGALEGPQRAQVVVAVPLGAGAVLVAVLAAARGDVAAGAALVAAAALAAALAAGQGRQRRRAAEELAAARSLVDAVSVVDEATGCYNANGLDLLARHVLGAVRRSSGAMHASLVELGDLGPVRELGGPEAVTEVVCGLADALRASSRGADVVGRWGPDLFVVLGPGTGTTPAELERRLRVRLLGSADAPLVRWACSLTVGSGLLEPWDTGGLAELVSRAEQDLALRRALRAPSAAEPARRRPARRPEDHPGVSG